MSKFQACKPATAKPSQKHVPSDQRAPFGFGWTNKKCPKDFVWNDFHTHMLHDTGIFTYIHQNMINVGKYSITMDPMGYY